MSQNVFVFTTNNGDGSSGIVYTKDPALLSRLEEEDPETYGMNEGYCDTLRFDDSVDLSKAGFNFYEDYLE